MRKGTPASPEPSGASREAAPLPARLLGLAQASHPFPVLAVLGLTAALAVASAAPDLDLARACLVVLAMLLSQLCIGWTNDYIDREQDAVAQPWKPVAAGAVPAAWLAVLAPSALIASLAVGARLGPAPFLLLAGGSAAGLAYDLRLKETGLSWLPFLAAFAALPAFVWSSLGVFRDELLWLYLAGPPLTLAAHVANALPDLEADSRAGRRSLVVRLGRSASLRLLAVSLTLAAALAAAALPLLEASAPLLGATLIACAVLLLAAARAYALKRRALDVIAFRLVTCASVVLAVGLLAAL